MEADHSILLYDGVCGFCNRAVRFVMKRDRRDTFRFAPLQGGFATGVLARHGLVIHPGLPTERLLKKARAALYVARELGPPLSATRFFGFLPDGLLNLGYDLVAKVRYKLFGKYDQCPLPNPADRYKFLDT